MLLHSAQSHLRLRPMAAGGTPFLVLPGLRSFCLMSFFSGNISQAWALYGFLKITLLSLLWSFLHQPCSGTRWGTFSFSQIQNFRISLNVLTTFTHSIILHEKIGTWEEGHCWGSNNVPHYFKGKLIPKLQVNDFTNLSGTCPHLLPLFII